MSRKPSGGQSTRNTCDKLWRDLIKDRAGWTCQACGRRWPTDAGLAFQAAHIHGRTAAATRTDIGGGRENTPMSDDLDFEAIRLRASHDGIGASADETVVLLDRLAALAENERLRQEVIQLHGDQAIAPGLECTCEWCEITTTAGEHTDE